MAVQMRGSGHMVISMGKVHIYFNPLVRFPSWASEGWGVRLVLERKKIRIYVLSISVEIIILVELSNLRDDSYW